MIEKMKFLSITGPKDDIDRVADVYLSKYEIHLENALSELDGVKGLRPFVESNPYKNIQAKCDELIPLINTSSDIEERFMSPEDAEKIINDAYEYLTNYQTEKEELNKRKKDINYLIHEIEPFRLLSLDLSAITNYRFIRFRYGKMSHEHFNKFIKYQYDELEVIFYETDSDDTYVWGMYFVPDDYADKIDAIFASLQFELIELPKEYSGNSEDIYNNASKELNQVLDTIKSKHSEFKAKFDSMTADILLARSAIMGASKNKDIRRLAACTKEMTIGNDNNNQNESHQNFYIICGWMSKSDAHAFLNEIENDPIIFCISEDGQENISKPPTKLKNPGIFKPYEMFIKMYGLPAYNELDPTIFIALTYSFLFGMMFGDVGQGLLLFVAGLILYKTKKMDLAAIISLGGFFSTIFGFMYGSIFGFEDRWIHPVWTSPMEDVMTVLFTAIGFGIFLNLTAMVLNIINGIKSKDKGRILFDTNGIAGFIFYILVVGCVVLFFLGYSLPATWILACCFGIPLLCIFLREPLGRLVEKKKNLIEGSKGMFFVEAFFELFEILLSFMTNSLSFVRVGAFALSHAGMMGVVLMLGKAEGALDTLTVGNVIVLIIGNLFVIGLEGLSVGIQVLRLEYYEMFSRFYRGTGRAFKPFIGKNDATGQTN